MMKWIYGLLAVLLMAACQNFPAQQREKENGQVGTAAKNGNAVRTGKSAQAGNGNQTGNSIYYWKTVFRLNGWEKEFLKAHRIGRLYMKFFDVAVQKNLDLDRFEVVPVATVRFAQNPAELEGLPEIVPTAFITLEALREMKGKETLYAEKIVQRLLAMVSYHGLEHVNEIQLDCDWTQGTFESYRKVCAYIRDYLQVRDKQLSITVRLHQLRDPEFPPADRGVLMLYNTGAFKNFTTRNSILDLEDARPYLKTSHIPFPMDAAWPAFQWSLLFRNREFVCISTAEDYSNAEYFRQMPDNRLEVLRDTVINGTQFLCGDIVRREDSDTGQIRKVKKELSGLFKVPGNRTLLYHLDSANLSKFTTHEISEIYSGN